MTAQIGNYNSNMPSGVNIKIFTSPVANSCSCGNCDQHAKTNHMTPPVYPANYYTQSLSRVEEKQKIVEKIQEKEIKEEPQKIKETKTTIPLNDEYIMKLESYLNSQDVEKRIMAAKDILARVQEDKSRKDNLALTALTNKMLKDPHQPIKFLALGILEERLITGNAETVEILTQIETGRYSKNGNVDQDAIKASNILLKMTRKV